MGKRLMLLAMLLLPLSAWAQAQAPSWHEMETANPIRDLHLDENGEGWLVMWPGTSEIPETSVHRFVFSGVGPPIILAEETNWESSARPRLAVGPDYVLVTMPSGILRWDGDSWTIRESDAWMKDTRTVDIDAALPELAIATLSDVSGPNYDTIILSNDRGVTWSPADPFDMHGSPANTAVIHGGAATAFPPSSISVTGTQDRVNWTEVGAWATVLDAIALPSGDLVGVGHLGHYVYGPVGLGPLVLETLDTGEPILRRVTAGSSSVFVLAERDPSTFEVFEVTDPSDPSTGVLLPAIGLPTVHAIEAAGADLLLVAGESAVGVGALLWRNRPPYPHPELELATVIEGETQEAMVKLALDHDGDTPSLHSSNCIVDAATTREVIVLEHESPGDDELFVTFSLPGEDLVDCPGPFGWSFQCTVEVTDGDRVGEVEAEGVIVSPSPMIDRLEPPIQEVETGSEAVIEVMGLGGCRMDMTAAVLDGVTLVWSGSFFAGDPLRYVPMVDAAAGPVDLLVTVTAADEDMREVEATATVRVTAPTLLVTAPSPTITYGDDAPNLDPTFAGFVVGDDRTSLDVGPTCQSSYGAGDPIGSYEIECLGGADSRYLFDYVLGTLSVIHADLVITAMNQTKDFGESFTFVGDEYEALGIRGADSIVSVSIQSDGAAPDAVPGEYPIVVSAAIMEPLASTPNYEIVYVEGVMEVLHPMPAVERCERDPSVSHGLRAVLAEGSGAAERYDWLVDPGDGVEVEQVTVEPELVLEPDRCLHDGGVIAASVTPVSSSGVPGESVVCEEIEIEHDGAPPVLLVSTEPRTMVLGLGGGSMAIEAAVDDCPGDLVRVEWRLLDPIEGLELGSVDGEELFGDLFEETKVAEQTFRAGLHAAESAVDSLLGVVARVELSASSEGGGSSESMEFEIDFALADDLGERIAVRMDLFAPAAREAALGDLVLIFGRIRAEAPFSLPGLGIDLHGGLEVIPKSLRVFDDCGFEGEGRIPQPGVGAGDEHLFVGEVGSECRGISFMARQGLGRPELSVRECSWTTTEGERALILDCAGGLAARDQASLGCSCATDGAGSWFWALLAIGALCLLGSRRRARCGTSLPWPFPESWVTSAHFRSSARR